MKVSKSYDVFTVEEWKAKSKELKKQGFTRFEQVGNNDYWKNAIGVVVEVRIKIEG